MTVRAHPRAGRDRVGPLIDGVLEVRVASPPADGRANEAIRRLLADALGTPPFRIGLVSGTRARLKRFVIDGMSEEQLAVRLRRIEGGD